MRRPRWTEGDTAALSTTVPRAQAVDSLQRGLEVLRCFRPEDAALDVAEVAQRVGLPRPTTRRLLDTLEQRGLVQRLPATDRFALQVGCLVLGHAVLAGSALARAARRLLPSVAERLQACVFAAVQERGEMMILAQATAPGIPAGALGPGQRLPLAGSALGHAWLWGQPAAVQSDWLTRLRSDQAVGATRVAAVYRSFQALEERGVCQVPDSRRRDHSCLATPVLLSRAPPAVLGCLRADAPGRDRSRQDRDCAAALRELALQLREEMDRLRAAR